MGEGREGDWECNGCGNRNYAFRSLCNRCKHPRLLVDTKTPADSKWLPRIGDWICTGCSNNNYASREKCKKCGQPKEDAAIPAIGMSGASLPTYAHYFARMQGLSGLKMNFGISGNTLHQTFVPNSGWPFGGADKHRIQPTPDWPYSSSSSSGYSYPGNPSQLPTIPKDWRSGDWMCNCGFHNYSSRTQCKKCDAPFPSSASSATANSAASNIIPTLGTKRLASEEFVYDWDNKRLHAGDIDRHFMTGQQHMFPSFGQLARSSNDQTTGIYSTYPSGNAATVQASMQSSQQPVMPVLIGKGAKQWRDGDWMCNNCNNHNFASRSHCNRCKTLKDVIQPVSIP